LVEKGAFIRVLVPMANGVDYIFGHSASFLTVEASFLPQLAGNSTRVQEVLERFLLRITIGTYGGSVKVSFPEIVPSEDFPVPK